MRLLLYVAQRTGTDEGKLPPPPSTHCITFHMLRKMSAARLKICTFHFTYSLQSLSFVKTSAELLSK